MMRVFLTTGRDVRHRYFLSRAFEVLGDAIAGVIVQTPGSGSHNDLTYREPRRPIPDMWIQLNHLLESKRIALYERSVFHTYRARLEKRMAGVPSVHTTNINNKKTIRFMNPSKSQNEHLYWTKERFTNPCIEKAVSKVFADR